MKKYRVNNVNHEANDEKKFNYNTTAELNPNATLREIKEKIGSTKKYKRAPGTMYLRCCEDIVAAATEDDFRMEVYSNGFAIYQSFNKATVLRMEYVGKAKYPDDPSVEIPVQDIDLEDMVWTIAVMNCGEDRIEKHDFERDARVLVPLYESRENNSEDNEFGGIEIDAGINIEEDFMQREEWTELLNALAPRQCACVEMYYDLGMTEKEIAKCLGGTQQSVDYVLGRARESVKKIKKFD